MLRALCIFAAAAAASACKPCTCGAARGARVVGGDALSPGEFPWLAALLRDDKVICGATVVAKDHLLTATHCVHEIEVSRLTVLHPDFKRYNYDNDIAVLRLAEPLPDNLFRPACLPDDEYRLSGANAIVSGWGSTSEKGPASHIPIKAEIQIWSEEECAGAGYGRAKVTPNMLCANAPGRDSCTGDSGGPLVVANPYFTLVGIVSWGRGCARQGYPGVYVRVDRFLPWLKVALRHACTCSPPLFP
ncbi:hypothetical protein ACJJTC_014751 [Scirpophaga incertulas]